MNDTTTVAGEPPCSLVVEISVLVFYPLVMIVGLPGNCLILRVYWAKPSKTSTTVLIMGLAWADLFSCLFMFFRAASSCLLIERKLRPEYTGCTDFLLYTAIASSLMITSVIAFDRYDCVCRPQRRLFNRKRAHVAMVCCVFYSATINLAGIVELFAPSPLTGIMTLVFQALCFVSALLIIITCYRKVYITIRKHVKTGLFRQKKFANRIQSSSKTNIMMMTSVVDGVQNSSQNTSTNLEETLDQSVYKIKLKNSITKPAWIEEPSSDLSTEKKGKSAYSISVRNDKFFKESNTLAATNAGIHASTSTLVSTSVKPSMTVDAVPASNEMSQRAPSQMRPADGKEKPSTVPQGPTTSLQRKTTRMLLITSVVLLISWMPRWVYVALLIADQPPMAVVHPSVKLVVGLSSMLVFINHAVNPIIYGFANRRFRKDCEIELQQLRCW